MTVNLLIGVGISLAVPLFALYLINTFDTFQTAKRSSLLANLVWGIVAFGLAYVLNTAVRNALITGADLSTGEALDIIRRISAPIVEEILKAVFLLWLITRPSFRYLVDGAVYGLAAGFGFAIVENIFYLSNNPGVALALAATRALSTSMMHGVATAIVGISLGMLRRSTSRVPVTAIVGILVAMIVHIVFNNVVNSLTGAVLLLVAIGLGLGGAAFIGFQVQQNIRLEKQRMGDALLNEESGVSRGEVLAIQRLGEGSSGLMDDLVKELGDEYLDQVRRLLVTQANIGILKNNLAMGNVSPRLRKAWEDDIDALEKEFQAIRQSLNTGVASYLDKAFPSNDPDMSKWLHDSLAKDDPTLLNTFDLFMFQSGLAAEFTPEQLVARAERLQKVEIFGGVDVVNLENLGRSIEIETIQPGTIIFDQGDDGDAMYLVESGSIDIFSVENGEQKFLRKFSAGQVVGDFSVLDGLPRSARARAGTEAPLVALILKRDNFRRFVQSRPQVILPILRVLGEKARFTTATVESTVRSLHSLAAGDYAAVATPASTAAAPVTTAEVVAVSPAAEESDSEITFGVGSTLASTFARLASSLQEGAPAAPTDAQKGAS
jgi:RsiW-degrading membrane proteinase PrsW (M82 family)/CRP-like cAMP-binding protein